MRYKEVAIFGLDKTDKLIEISIQEHKNDNWIFIGYYYHSIDESNKNLILKSLMFRKDE